jgi:hypothetical protein
MNYPRITELGLTVRAAPCGLSYVDRAELREALGPNLARFNRLLGLQTAIREGELCRNQLSARNHRDSAGIRRHLNLT